MRKLFSPPFVYTGADYKSDNGVDVVLTDPCRWSELQTESFDVVVSVRAFTNASYFWVIAAEIARVLSPRGVACVVDRSENELYRFGPTSWQAMCSYVQLRLLDSYTEGGRLAKGVWGAHRGDSIMVAQKPSFETMNEQLAFYARLSDIAATHA